MALAALFAANISAQEGRSQRGEDRKEIKELKQEKKELRHDRSEADLSLDEKTEFEIKYFCNELYLDKKQAAKFAKTYREYKKDINKVKARYEKKFSKSLNDRQVERILRGGGACHHCKGDCQHKGGPHHKHEHKK